MARQRSLVDGVPDTGNYIRIETIDTSPVPLCSGHGAADSALARRADRVNEALATYHSEAS